MNARLRATWLAAVLLVAFGVVLMVQPTGYMTLTPGPTLDLLGADGSTPWVTVPGHKVYKDPGQLRMLTVYEQPQSQKLSLPDALSNWLQDDTSVYPVSVWYPPGSSDSSNNQQAVQQMTSAEDSAKAAALQALGIKVPTHDSVMIGSVDPAGPSNGKIQPGDVLKSIDGKALTDAASAITIIKQYHPGDVLQIGLQRGKKNLTVSVKTIPKGTNGPLATQPRIGVGLGDEQQFDFPFKININMPDNIGGGSAGMMMALTIYDLLTPGSLTGGHVIAGTGTIGSGPTPGLEVVGPIGGIDQKIRGAQRDGAQLFLAPAANCDEVRNANYNHKTMRIVKVSTLEDAISAIKAWTANPNASLPGCSQ